MKQRSAAGAAGSSDHAAGLPVELTSFVGRGAELAELERLVAGSRLVTLTGAGGSGKTRLALELVEGRAESGSRVAWVELAALDDPGRIPQQVAEALGVRDEIRGADALAGLLRASDDLLVLDNCEHLVEACAELVQTLLRGCPALRVLATSREPLGVKGERAWLVPPLSLPSTADPGDAAASEAVRLFVARACDALPEFALTPENTGAVAEICRRLDGIPLAIELAAARIRVLAPEQIRERLDDAFHLLTGGGRLAMPRHRTLRATIDWSYDLLDDAAKVLLARQAVFRGGFTLDAAEAVCAGDGLEPGEVLDLVARLVDRSLLQVREHGASARYGPLETVRQYTLERLAASGEAEAVRRRHAGHVLRLVEDAARHATTTHRRSAFGRLVPEMENIREALTWTRDHEPVWHIRLAGKLGWFWFSVGHWTEARAWLEGALELPEAAAPTIERATLLFAVGALATLQGNVDIARPWLEESVAVGEALGDEEVVAYALNYLGMSYAQERKPEGRDYNARAEAWFRANGDDYGLRLALLLLGVAAQHEGKPEEAVRLTEEAVAVARRFGQDRELSVSLQNLGFLLLAQGKLERAEPLLMESLAAARRDPSYFFISNAVDVMGEVRLRQGRLLEAARMLGAAEAIRSLIGARQFEMRRVQMAPLLERVAAGPDAAAFEEARAAGRKLTPETILDEILGPPPAIADPTTAPAPAARPVPATSSPAPAGPSVDLLVRALGPLEVVRRGEPLGADAWPYAKPKELLLLLMLNPAGQSREQIGRAIWSGSSPAQVKNSFHVTLHHLRKTLGGTDWVVIEGDRYRLAPTRSYELDADRFEREARSALKSGDAPAAALRTLLAEYRGDLLEGEVTGPWVEEHRDRLRRVMVDLGLALGRALESEGDDVSASEAYAAIAAREDLNEEAHRRLMVALGRTGDRVRALRHYERLVSLLRDELDADPEPETVAVYESLRLAGSA